MHPVLKLNTVELLKQYHNSKVLRHCIPMATAELNYAYNKSLIFLITDLHTNAITIDQFKAAIDAHVRLNNNTEYFEELKTTVATHADLSFHIYPNSKTHFRKFVHPEMPDSLYKRYYKLLKSLDIITEANGSYVIMSTVEDTTTTNEAVKDLVTINTDVESKLFKLSDIGDLLDELKNDNLYYVNYLNALVEIAEEITQQKSNAETELQNKYLTSWY